MEQPRGPSTAPEDALPRSLRPCQRFCPGSRVHALAWSADGREAALGLADATIAVWNVKTGERRRSLRGSPGRVAGVAWSPDGRLLASATGDNAVMLWAMR